MSILACVIIIVLLVLAITVLSFVITKYVRRNLALSRELSEFKTLCDLMQTPIWFKDKKLRFTWVNKYYCMMFDRTKEQILGLTDLDIAPKKLVKNYIRDDEYVLESKKVYRYKENDKAGLWFDTVKFPLLDSQNNVYGLGGVAFNITPIKKSETSLHNLIHNDYLTGTANRLSLSVEATKLISECDEFGYKLAVVLLDIDNFKDLNDLHGHVVGDELLKSMAERLKRYASDKNILVGRFGGDEFILVIYKIKDEKIISSYTNDIKEILLKSHNVYDSEFTVECSMGVSVYPNNSKDYEGLVRYADMALFYAKSHGRNSIVLYNDEIGESNIRRINIETHLKEAIAHKELYLCYQPKVSADGSRMIGMEALLRWDSAELGFVSPAEFIPVAEQSDLIIDIGNWVLREALLQNIEWAKQNNGEMSSMAINLSVKQINKPDFLKRIISLLEEFNYPPNKLELEVTERMLMSRSNSTKEDFKKLREFGVTISVDDFGTGYSNLGYLSSFPLDIMKIDRSFVTDIKNSSEKQQIVNAIVQLAHSFNLAIIAEGVETFDELQYLFSKGVDTIQGFYFSKPLKNIELPKFIEELKQGKYKQKLKNVQSSK